jgi:hypothetical protein
MTKAKNDLHIKLYLNDENYLIYDYLNFILDVDEIKKYGYEVDKETNLLHVIQA